MRFSTATWRVWRTTTTSCRQRCICSRVALARNSNLFAAGVDVEGSPDLTVREIENLTISVGDDCAVILMPLEWTTPALIIHGDDDGTSRFRQSEQVDRALSEQGAPIEV